MEEKFNKYFKNFPNIFYFTTIMDPRIKFEGHKYLLEKFYEKMNYPYCSLVWKDIEHSINNMHDFMNLNLKINNHHNLHLHLGLKVLYYLHPKDQEVQTH